MRWIWIDSIIAFEPHRQLVAIKNVSRAEDYLHAHLSADGANALPVMPASLMIEGMAQTAGILVGTAGNFKEKVILAKVVRATFDEDVFPGQTIRYTADLDRYDPAGAATIGVVHRLAPPDLSWQEIGRVELLFSHLDQNMAGVEFPEENFVFCENFKAVLRDAGMDAEIPA